MKEMILFIDTETGGLDPDLHSLLSIGLVAWSKDRGIIDKMELFVKHESYQVIKSALKVNKFDLKEHDRYSISENEVIKEIDLFIWRNFNTLSDIQIGGHNVTFDIGFIKKLYKNVGRSFEKTFSHRVIDTYSIAKACQLSGNISIDLLSSSKLFKLFGIKVQRRHNALEDAVATTILFENLILLMQKNILLKNS